ncbi:MAG: FecR domain-containing protein [Candidatus Marinimicrobia bacterium]|nr:FecR domain-containing protein [Candidatus Neomarinimicrobiota bacterium]MBT5461967.1 FecR domain-containing protein [Candidatus Neomarinimicrobiota bacterium]MBT5722319.1 FecR domain-containing protein [Candidatus Neomarinimicrobiota bacterium]MBT5996509.1 FecR domain-containing protein [Candidatus Neomarinimicrobiota bacterium]MBT7821704.1 FecR domain-containing protein [Candidatus Neomarinimicrobiota bacterium]
MRYLSCFFIITSLLMAGGQKFGKISLPLGKVEFKSESSDWKRAKPNQPVFEGNTIRTKAKSRCEITLVGGGKIRLGENSELVLNKADVKPMVKNFNANLKRGNIFVSAKAAFGEKKNIAIRTPTAVAAIRGTKYRASAGEAESSVLVYEGKVDVNQAKNYIEERKEKRKGLGQNGFGGAPKFTLGPVTEIKAPTQVSGPFEVTLEEWVTLAEGMQINIRSDGKFHMFEFDQSKDAEDEFVKWNQELEAAK